MRLAVNIPNFGPFEDPHTVVDLARRAEAAGWDGLFVWDHLVFEDGNEVADPWVLLTAAAMATERLRLAPMVTPLPRRRPWVVARQAVSLDRLSNGRLILGVGIGEPADLDFEIWGEDADRKVRAAQLDEGLEVLTGLWSGEPFRFSGEHYEVGPVTFLRVRYSSRASRSGWLGFGPTSAPSEGPPGSTGSLLWWSRMAYFPRR